MLHSGVVIARAPSRLTLLTAALVVLLPSLAVLQYAWVGQLSEAERDRMQRNLRHAAAQFREAFDGEIARAWLGLHADAAMVRDEDWERYAERYAAWASTAPHPAIVANVFLVDADRGGLRLRRWNQAGRVFETSAWTGALARTRLRFEEQLRRHREAGPPVPPMFGSNHESLLIGPVVSLRVRETHEPPHGPVVNVFGCTVIELNMPFIRTQLLPALAQRHFPATDGQGYRVAVVEAAPPGQAIYRSAPDAPTDPARADVAEAIFGAQSDPVMFLARGSLQYRHAPAPSAGTAGPPGPETRNVVVSVIRERSEGAMRATLLDGAGGRWRLLVQHERGSLEAAVTGLRQRNLLISFGILLLMGVSIGLLAVSSRRAQRLAQQQMEFVAGVSHELRTPVAVIRSAAENLSQGVVGDPDRVRRYGDAIQREARRLGETVERVLQFAGIESGRQPGATPVDVAAVVEGAIEGAVAGEQASIERRIPPDLPAVLGDGLALRSAVQNVIENALKYGGPDRWVGVQVEAVTRGHAREVRIRVEDRGRGIATHDLPHIFEPFYRGTDAIVRQVPGNGLGLALVRRIVEAHRGRLSVETREGGGCAFTITLPGAAAASERVGGLSAPANPQLHASK